MQTITYQIAEDLTVDYDQGKNTYRFNRPLSPDDILSVAELVLAERMKRGKVFSSPGIAIDYARVHYGDLKQTQFGCIYLDAKHQFIVHEVLFVGTIDHATVHPREVVKSMIDFNAKCVILIQNRPSGDPTPTDIDIALYKKIETVVDLIDGCLVDHIIVGGAKVYSAVTGMKG